MIGVQQIYSHSHRYHCSCKESLKVKPSVPVVVTTLPTFVSSTSLHPFHPESVSIPIDRLETRVYCNLTTLQPPCAGLGFHILIKVVSISLWESKFPGGALERCLNRVQSIMPSTQCMGAAVMEIVAIRLLLHLCCVLAP